MLRRGLSFAVGAVLIQSICLSNPQWWLQYIVIATYSPAVALPGKAEGPENQDDRAWLVTLVSLAC